jgi:hypothetical protein
MRIQQAASTKAGAHHRVHGSGATSHQEWEAWRQYITATPAEVAAILVRWRGEEHFHPAARLL